MSTVTIDGAQALELLDRAVAEKGSDYVYETRPGGSCTYQRNGKPSCIVGHALNYAGVSVYRLRKFDAATEYAGTTIGSLAVNERLAEAGIELTPKALEVFSKAQAHQDSGMPWGDAVADARRAVSA